MDSNLELEASNYAIKFFDKDKTYTSLEVHKMICDAYIAGATSPKESSDDETNAPTEYGKYIDECLNDASKHFFSEGEDKYNVADLFYAGVRCGKSWIEKQDRVKIDKNN